MTKGSVLVKVRMTYKEYDRIMKSRRYKYRKWFYKYPIELVEGFGAPKKDAKKQSRGLPAGRGGQVESDSDNDSDSDDD